MGFIDGFKAGWGLGADISDALDAREVRKLYDEGQKAAAREAANSGRTVDVLPENQIGRGYGVDTADNRYATGRQAVADMIVGQENDIRALQNEARQEFMRNRAMLDSAKRDKDARARMAEPPQVREEPRVFERGYTTPSGVYAEEKTALPGYGMQTTIPARDPTQIFQEKYLPSVIAKLESQGRIKDAEAFRQWAQDSKNRRYINAWSSAVTAYRMGDKDGASLRLQELYNNQIEDGRHVVIAPSGNNDNTYVVQIRDNDSGRVVRQFTGNYDDIITMGLGVLSPENQVAMMQKAAQADRAYFVATPGSHVLKGDRVIHTVPTKVEVGPRETIVWKGTGKNPATGKMQYWRMREDGEIEWGPELASKTTTASAAWKGTGKNPATGKMQYWRMREDGEIEWGPELASKTTTASARAGGTRAGGKLTTAQQRFNEQVNAARKHVNALAAAGQNVNELAKRDKELAKTLALARQRLYGDDPSFTAWSSKQGEVRDISPLVAYLAKDVNEDRIRSARAKGWTREEIRRALAQIKGK